MGTLNTVCTRARVKIRDVNALIFTNADLMGLVNDILQGIYQTLCQIESNLIYGEATITTDADEMEYVPAFSHNGFLADGVWVDGEDVYLEQVSEADKIKWDYDSTTSQPEVYFITEDGKVGYLWVPDAAYTIHHQYFKPITEMSDFDTDDLPWDGIWNQAIQRMLVVEGLEIQERDPSSQAVLASIEWDKAMNMTYKRGIRQRKQVSGMFDVEGI